jgi:integrase
VLPQGLEPLKLCRLVKPHLATYPSSSRARFRSRAHNRVVPAIEHAGVLHSLALDHGQSDGLLFPFPEWRKPNAALKCACDWAKLTHCSFNDLRRTCATWSREGGASPDLIATVLGHVDLRMVE